MTFLQSRPIRLTAAAAALVAATGVLTAPSAAAATPVQRTYTDPADPGAAYDIRSLTLRSAPAANTRAKVVVKHARRVRVGDATDVWVNLDADRAPDLHITAYSFSEYAVFRARSFTRDGRDISDRDCARVSMAGRRTVVRLLPDCLGPSRRYAVSVRTSRDDRPPRAVDWAPARRAFTGKVWSYQPA
ncbi:hypothetical protein [Nocardioides pantholopis]|uniref:hypothetical protein n=1 Tax=Nocardioides pantholopis TaxID=2483798 RepID=UPI000F07F27C|nr:hypothetical protein [Nocardioides pantholopis]